MTPYTNAERRVVLMHSGSSSDSYLEIPSVKNALDACLEKLVALGWTPPPREEPLTAGMVLFRAMQHQTDEAEVKTLENECWERAAQAVIDWAWSGLLRGQPPQRSHL